MLLAIIAVILFGAAGVMYAIQRAYPSSMVAFGLAVLSFILAL